jgi:tryptophanyl-tRNA synthetase
MTTQAANKKRVFSGIQPSGNLHIGNYLGAILQWVEIQKEYECIFCVVDYHAITVAQDPKILNQKIIEIAKIYLASGIDPSQSTIFQQSAISAHTELCWIFNTISRMSDLFRMTQFKDKSGLQASNELEEIDREALAKINKVGVGLFDYPILMAADILLYNTDVVPVGDDQKQHVELARDLAKRFNHQFGETFKIPDVKVKKATAKIMGLDDPQKKMSKSAKSELNYISLIDEPAKAAKKIMKAVTDSESVVQYDMATKPAIANLMTIYSLLGNIDLNKIEQKYSGKGYGEFKKDLAEITKNFLADFQTKLEGYSDAEVKKILAAGAEKIRPIAHKNLDETKKRIGILL